ncbi:MAG: MarR family transcriptional regulator [Clostridiales bacterium]|nr:MarR family transcriptional regulator [Clostridiales bacterium]
MNKENLKNNLMESLSKVYFMEVFTHLTEFLQGELFVLYFLSQNKDEVLSPSTISNNLHMSRPRVTNTLATLKKKGFVSTLNSLEDRRRIQVSLTEKGISYIEEKRKNIEDYFNAFLDRFGERDTIELIRLIDLAVDTMAVKEK